VAVVVAGVAPVTTHKVTPEDCVRCVTKYAVTPVI
jgi:hypothetical protein